MSVDDLEKNTSILMDKTSVDYYIDKNQLEKDREELKEKYGNEMEYEYIKFLQSQLVTLLKSPRAESIFAVVLYGVVSLSQTIFNKKVITTYQFEASNVLLFCQMIVTIFSMLLLKFIGVLHVNISMDYSTIKKLLPLSFCYILNVLLGLGSLGKLNIPMYSSLKRLVALVIIVMEYVLLKKVTPYRIVGSVMVMVFGAVLAGFTDLTFSGIGYTLALTSCLFQASYLVMVKKVAEKISTFDMLYYNSVLSLPMITVFMFYNQEVGYLFDYQYLYNRYFQIYFVLSVVLGFVLNFCIFYCTNVCSPLTTSVTGQVKNILTAVLAIIIFKDIIIVPMNILGICINILGSMWYSYLKFTSTS
ncbi:solute carrier family 35 member protein [Tieghemostelium lacteum]|uniref:Solute carrier family 35 member protein n=1 Tax=Tieghemostelium lacteum TaxID=361077 RepID=A0A151ZIM9_TIELA|nr:solute carrier family 35 member protein [Tieghemostelium lacteum]|eukprot:KYQ93704.1 solute carrier family 35 member protein [Tieghemostelium lacteum]